MFLIHPYGLMISLAIVLAYSVIYLRRKLYGFSTDDLERLFLCIVPLGIIGARTYHVFDKWGYYSQNLGEIIAIWNGGLGIYGAIIGGLAGIIVFIHINNIQISKYANKQIKFKPNTLHPTPYTLYAFLDLIIPGLALGQAIGRWGNFFNHEVFGGPTNLLWGWYIPQQFRPDFWQNYQYFHPTFAYESLWVLVGFIILLILEKEVRDKKFFKFSILSRNKDTHNHKDVSRSQEKTLKNSYPSPSYGTLTAIYAIWYGTGRFFLEFLRFDTAEVGGGVKVAQIISVILVVWGSIRIYKVLRYLSIEALISKYANDE